MANFTVTNKIPDVDCIQACSWVSLKGGSET